MGRDDSSSGFARAIFGFRASAREAPSGNLPFAFVDAKPSRLTHAAFASPLQAPHLHCVSYLACRWKADGKPISEIEIRRRRRRRAPSNTNPQAGAEGARRVTQPVDIGAPSARRCRKI